MFEVSFDPLAKKGRVVVLKNFSRVVLVKSGHDTSSQAFSFMRGALLEAILLSNTAPLGLLLQASAGLRGSTRDGSY